jgi:hypothetical protein
MYKFNVNASQQQKFNYINKNLFLKGAGEQVILISKNDFLMGNKPSVNGMSVLVWAVMIMVKNKKEKLEMGPQKHEGTY